MKIAVTGAAGYLAQILMPVLEADETVLEIVATDIREPQARGKMKFFRHDVRDPEIKTCFAGCDTLVHLAFIVMPIHGEKKMDSINIEGSRNAFKQAAAAGVKKIVHLSSVAAYGAWPDNPPELFEDSPLRPMPSFYYSRTKGAVEAILDDFEKAHPEISVVRLRPCIFVGPNINNMMTMMISRKRLASFRGKIRPRLQFVWDEDVVDAIMLALKKDVRGAFNLAGDNSLSMEELGQITGAKVGSVSYTVAHRMAKFIWALRLFKYGHPGWLEVFRYPIIMNCDKAKKELGWTPSLDTAGAIRRLVSELRKQ